MHSVKVVLDTNGLLRCISRRSPYAIILDKLAAGEFELIVTTEILLEYEEKISEIFSEEVAERIIGAFHLLPNVKKSEVYFHLGLITRDIDDNKFSDCAFAGNAHFIVTDDKDFNELKLIEFPRLTVISLLEFKIFLGPWPLTDEIIDQLV